MCETSFVRKHYSLQDGSDNILIISAEGITYIAVVLYYLAEVWKALSPHSTRLTPAFLTTFMVSWEQNVPEGSNGVSEGLIFLLYQYKI